MVKKHARSNGSHPLTGQANPRPTVRSGPTASAGPGPEPPTSLVGAAWQFVQRAVVTSLAFAVNWAIALGIGYWLHNWVGYLTTAMVMLLSIAWWTAKWRADLWGLLLTLPMAMIIVLNVARYDHARGLPVPLAKAKVEGAMLVRLPDDLTPRLDLARTINKRVGKPARGGRSTRFRVQLVPLVPAGWTPDKPVDTWAYCADWEWLGCDEVETSGRIGVRPTRADEEDLQIYLRAAAAAGNLKTEQPVLVRLFATQGDAKAALAEPVLQVPVQIWLVWLVTRAAYGLYQFARGAKRRTV